MAGGGGGGPAASPAEREDTQVLPPPSPATLATVGMPGPLQDDSSLAQGRGGLPGQDLCLSFFGKGLERHDSNGDGWYVLRDYSDPCALCLLMRSVLGTALMRCCHQVYFVEFRI